MVIAASQVNEACFLASDFLHRFVEECCRANPYVARLKHDLAIKTSTDLFDWIEFIVFGDISMITNKLKNWGYVLEIDQHSYCIYSHPSSLLPRVVCQLESNPSEGGLALRTDNIADYLMLHGQKAEIEGDILSPFRRCCVSKENGVSLWLVEKRGTRCIDPLPLVRSSTATILSAIESWQTRCRQFEDNNIGMHRTRFLAKSLVDNVGQDMAAWIVLHLERKYWQARNRVGKVQELRQNAMGMGWGNHCHYTFRSSRILFPMLVRLFETLGFTPQQTFYAGSTEGWGSLMMTNVRAGLTVYLEVDLLLEELELNLGHSPLPPLDKLNRVGLWCTLHGDSILNGGMHHLGAHFSMPSFANDLENFGIKTHESMAPSIYPHMHFTETELSRVDPERIAQLLQDKLISSNDAEELHLRGVEGNQLVGICYRF